jgi:DNA-binding response OmpR family regulator
MSNARKILVIDDDDELRDSLSEQLSLHEEFETLLAETASDGLKLARNGHVDLVLLDVGLPDLDGREACKLLRRGGFKGPVIMLTGQVSDADTILGLESGASCASTSRARTRSSPSAPTPSSRHRSFWSTPMAQRSG